MPDSPLNPNSFEALYRQLAEKIRQMIHRQYPPGSMLPSESELMSRYNVSRNTVRQAVKVLQQQGYVISQRGKGTFVAPVGNRYQLMHLVSFSEDMHRRGLKPETRLLGLGVWQPDEKIAAALQLPAEELVHVIRRLRLADGQPMALSTAYIPQRLLPGVSPEMLASGSLFDLLQRRLGQSLGYADRSILPIVADAEQAALLQVAPGSPLMLVEGPAFLENDLPVEYVVTCYRGDRYHFVFHAVR
ncbi:MAG: GntR family transcriptional regulator [Chloroflexota bacterium]